MPTEAAALTTAADRHQAAARRILRLAFGASACLLFSQAVAWPLSFIAPILTLLILALPLPAPGLKKGFLFVAALLAPLCAGLLLVPFMQYARWTGVLFVSLGWFYSFYFTARGGSPVMGTFMTIGLTLVVTVGSVNLDAMIFLIRGLAFCAVVGMAFVWLAHAVLPDLPSGPAQPGTKQPKPHQAARPEATRQALRSLLIVMPLALAFMFMSASPAYTVVMIKVAALGQQASATESRVMGRELMESTLWGGIGAIIAWKALEIWPSLTLYTLLVALAGLLYGRWIFQGSALHPRFSMASYAFLTMMVILAPAVTDSPISSGAGAAFYSRMALILLVAVYGTAAAAVFDAYWPRRRAG